MGVDRPAVVERMRRLTELSRLASATLDVREVREFIVGATAELLRCDLVRLWQLDLEQGQLTLGAQATAPGLAPPTGAPRQLPLDTLIGHVATTGKRRYSRELAEDPLWRNPAWVRENGYRSQIALPLVAAGRSLGVLSVIYRAVHEFGDDEILLLESFAGQAAVAMRNASLYEELASAKDRLERALEDNRTLLESARHQALHDPLTGLPNRVLLQDRLAHAIAAARRERSSCALLLMDLDRFKEVNDLHGHEFGDAFLVAVGTRLRAGLREADTFARLGGDEFALVLDASNTEGAVATAAKVVESMREPFEVRGQRLGIGVSIGIARHPEDGADPETLLRHADIAMYAAKRARSGWSVYSEGEPVGTRPA